MSQQPPGNGPEFVDDATESVPPPGGEPARRDALRPLFDHGMFDPGTLIAGRYRIVALVGRGGMGEVYRADDLQLGQSVALKFLPGGVAGDEAALARFRAEVRLAREVSHPNVCRVYDIGEVAGQHFLSMEFIDGQDLAALVRSVGRFPQDRAIDLAGQLLSGLAAAHDRGVLHCDLKLSNIMVDGRGRLRITDFGLASFAADVVDGGVVGGTPAYMAPEQLGGRGVTTRSDIYSAGLVLYELFTGRLPFSGDSPAEHLRQRSEITPPAPSSVVGGIAPEVDRLILRCLEIDPRDRPPSALAVLAALPGADPLDRAVARGETPPPELLLEAGESGRIRPRHAALLLGAFFVALALSVIVGAHQGLVNRVPFDLTPEVLANRGERLLGELGHAEVPADRAWWFHPDVGLLKKLRESRAPARVEEALARGFPAVVLFRYRSSPGDLIAQRETGEVTWRDPPLEAGGELRMSLDTVGRLNYLEVMPVRRRQDGAPVPDEETVWAALFGAAGLEIDSFTTTTPRWTPRVFCEARSAWTGTSTEAPDLELRVEAGAESGRPVYFEIFYPWDEEQSSRGTVSWIRGWLMPLAITVVVTAVVLSTLFLAYRNVKSRRGDIRGAWRFAILGFIATTGEWLFTANHVASGNELILVRRGLSEALVSAALCWLFYATLEPYARRYLPHSMVSWTRLLNGRVRDALVGRDVLIACVLGQVLFLLSMLPHVLARYTGWLTESWTLPAKWDSLLGAGRILGEFFELFAAVIFFAGVFVLMLLLRIVLRRPWPAAIVLFLILTVGWSRAFTSPPLE